MISAMVGLKLKHVERHKGGRDGETRYYFRIGKGKRIALKGEPGTADMLESYADAAAQYRKLAIGNKETFNALIESYIKSSKFSKLKPSTKKQTLNVLDRFRRKHGHRIVRHMGKEDADRLYMEVAFPPDENEKAKRERKPEVFRPGAANFFLHKMKALIKFAIKNLEWKVENKFAHIEPFALGEHHTWTEEEIAQFERKWALGTIERFAFDLHLYTGQRTSDVVKILSSDIDNMQSIGVVQQKTGASLVIPMHKTLCKSMAKFFEARPIYGKTVIAKRNGQAYGAPGLGNLLSKAIDKAGLPSRCVPHGTRKAAARRLAEAGCSPHQIQAITGHTTLKEVERYTKAANQKKLAGQAIDSLGFEEIP